MTDAETRSRPLVKNDEETHKDLVAAIGARMELGAGMEEHVIDTFLARVESRLTEHVNHTVVNASKSQVPAKAHHADFASVVAPSLALSIPLVAIAGAMTGAWGVAAVMACVFALNFMYFLYELLHP